MYQLDYSRGAMPLYLQIKAYIKLRIEDETYAYGVLIPTEPEYEEYFGVSRMTVRQAINELQRDGYVRRIRGRGTEVIYTKSIEEELNHIQSFSDEMSSRGFKPGTSFVEVEHLVDVEDIPEEVRTEYEGEVLKITRVRTADDKPIVVFITYLVFHPALPQAKEAYANSMYELIEVRTGKKIVNVKETFSAIAATADVAKLLQIPKDSPILFRLRTAYDQEQHFLEYTESYYRGDTYRYTVNLKAE